MTRSGIRLLSNRRRAAVAWLAVLALLNHALVPPALMAATGGLNPGVEAVKSTLCSAASEGDASGRAKPGPPVHYCALCTVSAVDLYRPAVRLAPAGKIARAVYSWQGAEWPTPPLRHGQVQARAPPATA